MEISSLIGVELVSSSGIIEPIPLFLNTKHDTYIKGELLRSEEKIYERTDANFFPPLYDVADEATYGIHDIVFKDGKLHFVSEINGGTVIKQPEEYGAPTSMAYSTWGNRYAKLGTLSGNVWTKTTNEITHRLYLSGSQWRYKVTKLAHSKYWGAEVFNTSNHVARHISTANGYAKYAGVTVKNFTGADPAFTQGVTTFLGTDSRRYRVGTFMLMGNDSNGYANLMGVAAIQREETSTTTVTLYDGPVDVYTECAESSTETPAMCITSSNCQNEWRAKTIIRRGDDLYVRTDTNDPIETKATTSLVFEELKTLAQINGWGWTYLRPSSKSAPFDGKKYTFVSSTNEVEYVIKGIPKTINGEEKSNNIFNTVAITGLIAEEGVQINFLPDDGSAVIPPITLFPNSNRDINNVLSSVPTTLIVYATRPIVGRVHLRFMNTGRVVRIGDIHLGQNVNAGFTNLVFTNKFKDYSPYERDQWGNVMYVEGVKTNIFSGTVDVELTNYDMMNRLMTSIGGKEVILNGSDTQDNDDIDNENFFASTMVVGRIRNFALKTKLDKKEMHQMASYSFEIEESV